MPVGVKKSVTTSLPRGSSLHVVPRRSPKTNAFKIGDSGTFTCPWTGDTEKGVIADPSVLDRWRGQIEEDYYDIEIECGRVEINIHHTDISEVK